MAAAPFTYHVMAKGRGMFTAAMVACTTWVSIEGLERLGWRTLHVCHGFDEALTVKGKILDAAVGIGQAGMVTP